MRHRFRGGAIGLLALAFSIAASGCGSTDRIILTTSPRLNICEGDEPHPIVVRIYYLKDTSRFARADFDALWDDDHAVLADDRIAMFPRTLNPRQQLPMQIPRGDETKEATAIGVVANFCRPGAGGCWRKMIPIVDRNEEIRIHLDEGCLSID